MTRSVISNFLLFQLGWFASVLGGAYDQAVLGSVIALIVIAYHIYRAPEAMKELQLLAAALIMGFIFESILTYQGLARYSHGQPFEAIAPLWMIIMWPLFATTLNVSLRWLKNLAPLLNACIGALLAPLAYYAGNRLGAVTYDNFTISMSVIAIVWAALLPAMTMMSLKLDGYRISALKPDSPEHASHV
jgi:hypothetical protein